MCTATDYLVGDPRAELSERGLKEVTNLSVGVPDSGSTVRYHPNVSVYNINTLGVTDFDVILFCGVYYHLRHPLSRWPSFAGS